MAKIAFITQGCSANIADSEIMQGLLKEAGHDILKKHEDAELIVFNTCTVKGPTETSFWKKLKEMSEKKKKIVVAGCIPQSQDVKGYSQIGTYDISKIVDVAEATLKGEFVRKVSRKNSTRLNISKIRKNPYIEIVPISQGCNDCCTFCKTKQARGGLISEKPRDIIRHISKAVSEGVKEIWITSQDNSVYGHDIGYNIVKLLKDIISIPRDFKIRLGMSNPGYIRKHLDELIKIFKDKKMYKFLHIPVQSGSDKVLKDMNRSHTSKDFYEIMRKFRKEMPDITISTDIICGFPTEDDDDFDKTVKLLLYTKPDIINVSRYWPRPGTKAAKAPQLGGRTVKERTKKISELYQKIAYMNNQEWIGWKGKIFVTEKGKEESYIGRNRSYKPVIVKGDNLLGKTLNVKITKATSFDLRAEISR